MVELGVVLGLAGIATGAVSILYAHAQVSAARKQAEQAVNMTVLEANQHIFQRLHNARERLGRSERMLRDVRENVPDLQRTFEEAGGFEDYILVREVLELFQDAFFMRRAGIVTDAYWRDVVGNVRLWNSVSAFEPVFRFSTERDLLHPDFVSFLRDVAEGKKPADPLARA